MALGTAGRRRLGHDDGQPDDSEHAADQSIAATHGCVRAHRSNADVELLRFADLDCHYGAREIFSGLGGVLNEGERIGLVGPNGAGKSSLLRLLAGVERPFGGSVVRARDAKLGYLAQSVADETEATLQELIDAALAKTHDAQFGLRSKSLRIMLTAFGFSPADFARPLRAFSGGQRAKAALAHLLIDEPDYLILDEPTNHLDIGTVRWLESFIASDKRSYIIVSHDRYFLDRVATRIWEMEAGRLHAYAPSAHPYAAFLDARAIRHENERRAYETFVAERETRRATIAGLRATHTSSDYSQVRSREKQLARVEAGEVPVAPVARAASIAVRLESSRRAGNGFAFEIAGLSKSFATPLFHDLTIEVERGERVAVVGPNGSGKSTLLKTLAGELSADSGSVRYNPAASVAYFAQNAHDQLDVSQTAAEAVIANAGVTAERARALLGRMRISGDASDKTISSFSGGERRRIMLACLMGRAADILLLDEPTNDLDIESREALESVLMEYEGTIVAISHDRYFLSRVCERVLWIEGGSWGAIDGGYDAYEATQREREAAARESGATEARTKTSRQTPLKVRSQLESQIARAEREITKLDARKAEIDALFAQPELYEDRARVSTLETERDAVAAKSHEHVIAWEALLERLAELDRSDV
jgi:ATP-binding cassette subfamily F protein 3